MMMLTVNGQAIQDQAINLESAHHQGEILHRQHQARVSLAVRELLLQRAAQLGLDTATDPEAAIETLLEQELALPELDEAACRRYFQQNPEQFRSPDLIEVRHILLPAAPADLDSRLAQRTLAESLIKQLRAAPERFAQLAREHSACSSAAEGGHLGQIDRGQTVPEFEKVVLRLPLGLGERPVETRYGFHVVEVLARDAGAPLPYDYVKTWIGQFLSDRAWHQAAQQYVQALMKSAEIEGLETYVQEIPLVQL